MYNKWFAEVHHVLVAWHARSLPACVHFVWQDATIVEAMYICTQLVRVHAYTALKCCECIIATWI